MTNQQTYINIKNGEKITRHSSITMYIYNEQTKQMDTNHSTLILPHLN